MKVVIHQGFHKTGTRTFQSMLFRNRELLKKRANILLPRDLKEVGFSARRYAVLPQDRVLQGFRTKLRAALEPFVDQEDKPLLISSEEFAGMIPGRKNVWSYTQTHVLAQVLLEEVQLFAGGKARVTFFYTTRNPSDWIKSVYWQNIQSNRILEDLSDYYQQLKPASDLDAVVSRVEQKISAQAHVVRINVSDTDDRFLALTKVLSVLNVRSDDLIPVKNANVQPSGAAAYFLELNRSGLSDEEVQIEKRAYLDGLKVNKVR